MIRLKLKIFWNSLLLLAYGDWSEMKEIILKFFQRVWPFSRWDFTEAAHTRRKILTRLAETREGFYMSLRDENEHK
jgi:hypothetical protein